MLLGQRLVAIALYGDTGLAGKKIIIISGKGSY